MAKFNNTLGEIKIKMRRQCRDCMYRTCIHYRPSCFGIRQDGWCVVMRYLTGEDDELTDIPCKYRKLEDK